MRGIRNSSDLEFETVLKLFNSERVPEIETVFLIPPRKISEVSSSFVKSLIGPRGWQEVVGNYVPEEVVDHLRQENEYG